MKFLSTIVLTLALTAAANSGASSYKSITPLDATDYNRNSSACCFIDWGVSGWLSQDREFPDAQVLEAKTGKSVSIRDLVKGRPIVLEMGSLTCPSYDLNVKRMTALADKYKGKVDFYTLYVRENHPNHIYKVHTSMDQKIEYAKELAKLGKLNHTVLVDDVKGTLHQALGNFGNAVFLVGTDMRTNHWSIFSSPKHLEKGIESLLSANGLAAKAKFVGGTDIHPMIQSGYSKEEKATTIGRMNDRGEPKGSPSYESLLKHYDVLGRPTKAMFDEMPSTSRDGIKKFLKTLSTKGSTSPELKPVYLEMQTNFRAEYTRRYEAWKQLNEIEDKANLATELLQTP